MVEPMVLLLVSAAGLTRSGRPARWAGPWREVDLAFFRSVASHDTALVAASLTRRRVIAVHEQHHTTYCCHKTASIPIVQDAWSVARDESVQRSFHLLRTYLGRQTAVSSIFTL